MNSKLKQLATGLLVLAGVSAKAENSGNKMVVSRILVAFMTQSYSKSKLQALFDIKLFQQDPNSDSILIDRDNLEKLASITQDNQIMQLIADLEKLSGTDTFVRVVDPNEMILASQDRVGGGH